jgi:hypothetical protein
MHSANGFNYLYRDKKLSHAVVIWVKKYEMKIIILFCIILLLAIGCRKNTGGGVNNNFTKIFPDRIGDIWVYNVADTIFTLQNIDSIKAYDMIVSVTGRTVLSGGIEANVWVFDTPVGIDTNYVFQSDDTINFAVNRGTGFDIIRSYVVPLQLHNSWEYSSNSINDVTVDSQANIVVGSNQFDNAFHLSGYPGRPDQIVDVEEWIKDSVGVVKRYLNTSTTNNPVKHHTSWSIVDYRLQ